MDDLEQPDIKIEARFEYGGSPHGVGCFLAGDVETDERRWRQTLRAVLTMRKAVVEKYGPAEGCSELPDIKVEGRFERDEKPYGLGFVLTGDADTDNRRFCELRRSLLITLETLESA